MASFSPCICDNCGNGYDREDVFVLRSYDHTEFVEQRYLCKKCDDLPLKARNISVVDYVWQCFLCGCYMDENFFAHDDGCNVCFDCLKVEPQARVWHDENGNMLRSYDVALELEELDSDNILVAQFNKRRADAVLRKKKNECLLRQRKVMAYEKIADMFVQFLPGLDMCDARDLASMIDVDKTVNPKYVSSEYEFVDWMMCVKKK